MTRKMGGEYNERGILKIKQEGSEFFWLIEGIYKDSWQEIPKYLYDSLNKFQDKQGSL